MALPYFSSQRQLHNVEYALALYQPIANANIHVDPYWANKAITTTTDVLAYTVGFGAEIVKNKLAVQGDYLSGNSNVSGAIVNLLYRMLPQLQVYVGVGAPETDSENEFYGTMGLSLFSKGNADELENITVVQ